MKKVIAAESIMQTLGERNTIFNRKGIEYTLASSSEEIIDLHSRNKADLIISDDALPQMGGAKLCAGLRSSADLKNVSIILVCENDEASLSRCREAGANIVFPKPLDPGALLWKTSELLLVPQRKDMRVLLRGTVKGMEKSTPFFAQSHDISISGMLFETDFALRKGDQVTCTFHIRHTEVTIPGQIERLEVLPSGRSKCGMKFSNYSTKTLVIIEHFVKAQPKR